MNLRISQSVRGVTLIELLVVVGILGLLAVLLLPVGRKILASGKNVGCLTNLKQISVASSAYSTDHNGAWPPNATPQEGPNQVFSESLKPYLGPIPERPAGDFRRSPFVCPADHRDIPDTAWNYQGVYAPLRYGLSYAQNSNLTSGTSQVGHRHALEHPSQTVLYMDFLGHYLLSSYLLHRSYGNATRADDLRERHGGSLNAAFADGSVQSIAIDDIPTTSPSLFWQGRDH